MSVSLSIRHKWHQIRRQIPRETRRAVHEFFFFFFYLDLARFKPEAPAREPSAMLINFLRWDATYFFLSSADDTLRLTVDRLNGDVNDVDAPVRLLLSVAETQPFRILQLRMLDLCTGSIMYDVLSKRVENFSFISDTRFIC